MGVKYVDNFEFPAAAGFTGSRNSTAKQFAKGGAVKQSPQFKMKTEKQDSMDHGTQPKRRGRNQAEIEAGGQQRVKLKFEEGGRVSARDNSERRIINNLNANADSGKASDEKVNAAIRAHRRRHSGVRGLRSRSARELEAMGMKKGGAAKSLHSKMMKHGGEMGFKKGAQHKYNEGGKVENEKPEIEVEVSIPKKRGGSVTKGHMRRSTPHKSAYEKTKHAHMSKGGQSKGSERRNRPSTNESRTQGEGVKAAGRGRTQAYKEGGLTAAKKVMDKHIAAPKPRGHGVKAKARGGYMGGGRAHNSTAMYGKYGR